MPPFLLNADLGEGMPWDEELLGLVDWASVCCGAHAGDPESIARTLEAARGRGVVVGAHPGYPDREGFGRVERPCTADEARQLVAGQVADLRRIADPLGIAIAFLKPHGALYNQARRDPEVARGIAEAARDLGLGLVGLPEGAQAEAARALGVAYHPEGFADRGYRPDGTLIPRGEPGDILHEEAAIREQVGRLFAGGIKLLCIHGDQAGSPALAARLRALASAAGDDQSSSEAGATPRTL